MVKGRVAGLVVVSATNLGDASPNPEPEAGGPGHPGNPVTIAAVLPPGLEAVEIEGTADETQGTNSNPLANARYRR